MAAYLFNGEVNCEHCSPDCDDDDAVIGGEADSPQHCSACHRPLFDVYGLTSDGQAYVLKSLEERLRKGTAPNGWRWEHGYYIGMNEHAVMRDWCEELATWRLGKREQRIVQWYLYLTEPGTHGHPAIG